MTKHDILEHMEKGSGAAPAAAEGTSARPAAARPVFRPGERVEIQPMSVMRKKIAEHMVLSKRTSAHVYSVFEVTYSRVEELRKARKADYDRQGAKLTYTSFIARAVVDTLRRHPVLNASIDGDNVVYKKDVNLGIAVALDNGLIVPVIKDAGEKNLLGLSRAIGDVADRARAKKLNPEEVQGGTFTITNPGTFGAQFGLPIINQPQVAILGVGAIEKRAGGDRRHDRHPTEGLPHARLRPPPGGRRGRRSVHGRREGVHRGVRGTDGLVIRKGPGTRDRGPGRCETW